MDVIYEDRDFIVINKPAGLLVHPVRSRAPQGARSTRFTRAASNGVHGTRLNSNEKTLVDWLIAKYPEVKSVGDNPEERPGIVHRLDKETSGLMVIARNQKAFEYLKNLFQNHEVKKTYLGLVLGRTEKSFKISKPIGQKRGSLKRTVRLDNAKMIKDALTEFEAVKFFKFRESELTLIKARPLTGRTHQIRIHLNSINHPVLGDKLYGGKIQLRISEELGLKRHFLHAESMEFTSPAGSRLKFTADLPSDLSQALDLLSLGHQGRPSGS